MRQFFLLTLLAGLAYYYFFYNSSSSASPTKTTVSAQPARSPVAAQPVIIVATSSSYSNRWKTGPNAQTDFEPFLPNEQATWNRSCGYTIIGRTGR